MIAFEVSVNGEKICTAGVGNKGILNATIIGPNSPRLHLSGLSNEENMVWITHRPESLKLKVGDEVTVRIVETEVVDEPMDRYVSATRAERESEVKEHLEKARALLPESADLDRYRECLEQNHLMGAMDALEKLGELCGANQGFWEELRDAAHAQTAYEDRDLYEKKRRAVQGEAKTEQE